MGIDYRGQVVIGCVIADEDIAERIDGAWQLKAGWGDYCDIYNDGGDRPEFDLWVNVGVGVYWSETTDRMYFGYGYLTPSSRSGPTDLPVIVDPRKAVEVAEAMRRVGLHGREIHTFLLLHVS